MFTNTDLTFWGHGNNMCNILLYCIVCSPLRYISANLHHSEQYYGNKVCLKSSQVKSRMTNNMNSRGNILIITESLCECLKHTLAFWLREKVQLNLCMFTVAVTDMKPSEIKTQMCHRKIMKMGQLLFWILSECVIVSSQCHSLSFHESVWCSNQCPIENPIFSLKCTGLHCSQSHSLGPLFLYYFHPLKNYLILLCVSCCKFNLRHYD